MVENKFYIHNFDRKVNNNDLLVINILNLIKKYKVNINDNFSILVNNGPGRFSSIRVSLAVAKGIKISKKINLYGFNDKDLDQFNPVNIELLIKKNLLQKNLIKPLYIS
jgi:tRNA A37 threonylcarbamoyladenosine modification protein TsaB